MKKIVKIRKYLLIAVLVIAALPLTHPGLRGGAWAFVINNFWPDSTNIVMDDVFLPAATWSAPAQFQLSEWNEVDTADNSHAFRINSNPEFSFSAGDGDNTMGFLGESGLNSVYGLSYANALAWAVCRFPSGGRYNECDMMLDPTRPWQLTPASENFFQSTVVHEAGHIRGLGHYDNYLATQNSGVDKILRGETLYMDDKEGVRRNATHVSERDMVIYNKFHNGSVPLWMSVSPTTARVGQTVNFNNITVENRGTIALGVLRFGIYFSDNNIISTGDQLLNTGSFGSFGTFTFSTFNWSATVPSVNDCSTRFIGGIIDDNNVHAERFEGNNAVAFSNNSPNAQPFAILLERDFLEPNDSFGGARTISLPFSSSGLNLDQDFEQDFYRFTLTQNRRVTLTTNFTHTLGDVDMDLRNNSNTVLASSTSTGNSETITHDLTPGTYYVRVYGFGGGSCNRYSLTGTSTALSPTITVSVPNGGETWRIGTTRAISWTSANVAGNVRIQVSRNGGSSWTNIFSNTANDGTQNWVITGPATTQARIRVLSVNNTAIRDASNANFRISN